MGKTISTLHLTKFKQAESEPTVVTPLARSVDKTSSPALKGRGKICLVTSAAISYNPRVVKEADALSAAGFSVRVVAAQHSAWVVKWDADVAAGRAWQLAALRWDPHNWRTATQRFFTGLRQRLYKSLAKHTTFERGVAELAYCRLYQELLHLACAEPADLYIAHNPQALPVACRAAEKMGATLAFDSEDYHTGEFPAAAKFGLSYDLLHYLEAKYLPRCCYITAPSEAVAAALASRYGIPTPLPIYNVFPWADRATLDGQTQDRRGPELSLYWYSQIIGLDRGIQDCLRAAALLTQPVQIHLRGLVTPEVKAELLKLAAACGVAERLYFHAIVPPQELLSRAAEHDVGLALEPPVDENKFLTVSNKLFSYFLAGLTVAASDTAGQRSVMQTSANTGFLYASGDYQALARELQQLLDAPALLQERKAAALSAAQTRWNWELEGQNLVAQVAQILSSRNLLQG